MQFESPAVERAISCKLRHAAPVRKIRHGITQAITRERG